jgi:hypothetical protein
MLGAQPLQVSKKTEKFLWKVVRKSKRRIVTAGSRRVGPDTGVCFMEYRRQVAMRRDGDDFVIAFQPDDIVVFRNKDADALRKVCRSIRWQIVSDKTGEADEPESTRN